jgi:hypothetical protein
MAADLVVFGRDRRPHPRGPERREQVGVARHQLSPRQDQRGPRFLRTADCFRSLSEDRLHKAKAVCATGQGDRGDRCHTRGRMLHSERL